MAYIVLVAGAVMALLGVLAIVTGYPIIQIERGWATVIAGSTLLAGGVVTMALAFLLRAVAGLREGLANATAVSAPISTPSSQTDAYADTAFRGEPHASPESTPNYGTAALGAAAMAVPVAALALTPRADPEPETHRDPMPATEHPAPVETDRHDEGHAAVTDEPPASPPIDDWLDKAFADLSLDPPHGKHEAPPEMEPRHAEEVATHHDGELLYAAEHDAPAAIEHPAAPREDHAGLAPMADAAPAPAQHEAAHAEYDETARPVEAVEHAVEPMAAHAPSDEPAVIGRYEADGTAYTMFADGSIEAQSDAGIYRFASMADLKAFIEG